MKLNKSYRPLIQCLNHGKNLIVVFPSMTRARQGSIVSNIASHAPGAEYYAVPQLLDDTYLFNQLEKLSAAIGNDSSSLKSSKIDSEEEVTRKIDSFPYRYRKYTLYLKQLDDSIEEYETILAQSQDVNEHLIESISMFNSISDKTRGFMDKTKDLHKEYTELSQLCHSIPPVLQHFEALDPIMRRLNHSYSANIVRKNSFKTMISNIDASLIFLGSHPDLVDSEKYRIKFKRCFIRTCGMISHYLKILLNQTCAEINTKLTANSTTNVKVSRGPLLYNKFSMIAEEHYSQVIEISSRTYNENFEQYHDELNSIMNECYDQYFQIRLKLLQPVTSSLVSEITADDKDNTLVKYIQDGKSYFQQLCIDEYNLFIKFFPEEQSRERINQWLCQLCEPLYDSVRTRILRETDIATLCDSVTLFSQYYQFEENSEEYTKQFHDIKFDKIFEPIVQKLQARLILRAQIFIQDNIVKYTPTKDSFIISRRKNKGDVREDGLPDNSTVTCDVSHNDTLNYDDNSYYPTLSRALWLLSKIYEMVNSVVFDDLAHHIVHDCIFSLRKAYDMAQSSSNGVSNLDVMLAYLKNLLMLRQEIQNFNIQYTVNETYLDFSGVESFFKARTEGVRERGGSIFTVAKSLVPKVVNSMVDARTELMAELRNVIKDFTDSVAKYIIENTLDLNEHGGENELLNNNLRLRNYIEEKLPHIHAQISSFIEDEKIVMHLIDAIQETIIRSYNDFYEKASEKAETGSLDKTQVSELMYNDVFADFINKITTKLINDAAPL